jgi:negative regulator of flagellin synthesis FlgM
MKIGNNNTPAPAQATGAVARGAAQEAAPAAAKPQLQAAEAGSAAPGSTTVKLSATASSLLSASSGDFDADKVERMRRAIADGSFSVNAEVIADKLIANAQELLGKSSH